MSNLLFNHFLFYIAFYIPIILCQVHYKPPVTTSEIQYIRLNSIHQINQPKINLTNIYKRQVYKLSSDNKHGGQDTSQMKEFQPCQEYPAEVQFEQIAYYPLPVKDHANMDDYRFQQQSKNVIYNYQTIKSQHRNIVDMIYYNDHIFIISSTGVVSIYHVDQSLQQAIVLKKTIDAIIWEKIIERRTSRLKQQLNKKTGQNNQSDHQQIHSQLPEYLKSHHIRKGYFELMDQTQMMLFANRQILIGIDIRTLKATLLSEQTQIQVILNDKNSKNQSNTDDKGSSDKQGQKQDEEDSAEGTNDQKQDKEYEEYKFPDKGYSLKIKQKYQYLESFQTVTKIDQNYFAVLDKRKGAIIYKLQKSSSKTNPKLIYDIEKVSQVGRDEFGYIYGRNEKMNMVGMKYSPEKRLLLMMDYDKGVFAFERKTVNKPEQTIDFRLSPNRILKQQCTLMEYSPESQSLFLCCNKIHRISLTQWPLIHEKTYLHPMINIREVFPIQNQNLIVFAGYSTFKLMYLDRLADYYEDQMLDKIIFHGNRVAITANEEALYVYTYQVRKPSIVCETRDENMVGEHFVMLRTTAECSGDFIKDNETNMDRNVIHQQNDVCVYTTYKSLFIWKQREGLVNIIIVSFIIFVIATAIMLFWICITIFRSWRARKYLDSLATTHVVLVEEGYKSSKYNQSNDIAERQNAQTGQSINKVADSLSLEHHGQEKL